MGPPSVYKQDRSFKTKIQQTDNREQEGETEIDTASTNVSITYARAARKPLLCDKGDTATNNTFIAGNVKNYIDAWHMLTSDSSILTAITGYKIDFFIQPAQLRVPTGPRCSSVEATNISLQIEKFLKRGIIIETSYEPSQFISPVFLRQKKDGTFRMILAICFVEAWPTGHSY